MPAKLHRKKDTRTSMQISSIEHPTCSSRRNAIAVTLAFFLASLSPAFADHNNVDEITRAREAVAALAASLRKSLGDALSAGGPIEAVAACRTIAPEATQSESSTRNLSIGRTALRVRNTGNTPDAYERRVLENFLADIAGGADPAKLEHAEVVLHENKRSLRYMKPIMMAEQPCGTCHGSSIAPKVDAAIRELYPDDTATGFTPGEMRGAFTVAIPLSPNP
jgi:hypothetical protein